MRLALFQPDIPQNLGSAIRLSACFGVPLDIIEPCGFPLTDKALKRTAMDYGLLAEITRHSGWTAFCAALPGRLLLFTTRAPASVYDFAFEPGDTLLMGRESAGVPEEVHQRADHRLIIPIRPGARSFNLSTAAAMGLSEALRQTGGFPALPDYGSKAP